MGIDVVAGGHKHKVVFLDGATGWCVKYYAHQIKNHPGKS